MSNKPDPRHITGLPLYFLPVRPGKHQFYGFNLLYDRIFDKEGAYNKRRPKETPAHGFQDDGSRCVPLWPCCSRRVQGMYHTPNDDLQILCVCQHSACKHQGSVVYLEDCQACELQGK